jgi:transcriptional regulator with PAS, ATPase and Fis domain
MDLISQVAPLDTSILILGESGTGKEKIADCIHMLSPRKTKPIVKINCAALPASLIESELAMKKGLSPGQQKNESANSNWQIMAPFS